MSEQKFYSVADYLANKSATTDGGPYHYRRHPKLNGKWTASDHRTGPEGIPTCACGKRAERAGNLEPVRVEDKPSGLECNSSFINGMLKARDRRNELRKTA